MRPRPAAPDAAIAQLLALIDEAFDKKAWHGVNLRGSLRRVDVKAASWRPGAKRHNIWEIAVHAAYWKYAVRRRLTGEKRGSFVLEGSNWFRRPNGQPSPAAWAADVDLLGREHRLLRQAISRLNAADLPRMAPGARTSTIGTLVRGIAAHDLYHAGQIQLLKRLQALA